MKECECVAENNCNGTIQPCVKRGYFGKCYTVHWLWRETARDVSQY